jgi:glycosyltransferase involved in cell wall biosynthesis
MVRSMTTNNASFRVESPSERESSFSVIISSYNYERYVVEALESVLAQTLPAHEIIVVDDGSSDHSVDLLTERFGGHPRVRLIPQKNGGQLSAWVTGGAQASGDVIVLMDSDDLWKPHYLERIAAEYERDPSIDFIYCNMELFGSRSGLLHRQVRDRDLGISILMGAFINRWQGSATSALSLRSRLFSRLIDLPEEMIPEWRSRPDDCLVLGADILGAHKYYIAEPLVRHREHGSNALLDYSKSSMAGMRYVVRNERMVEYYRQKMGVTDRWRRLAKQEFKTKNPPTFRELLDYSRLLGGSSLSFMKRLAHRTSMLKHYLQHLFART